MPHIKCVIGLEPKNWPIHVYSQRRHSSSLNSSMVSSPSSPGALPHVRLNKLTRLSLNDKNSSMLNRPSTVKIASPLPGKVASPSLNHMRNMLLVAEDRSTPDTYTVSSALKERRKRSINCHEEIQEHPIPQAKRRRQKSQQSNASTSSMPSLPDNLPDLSTADFSMRLETPGIKRPSRPRQADTEDWSKEASMKRARNDIRNNPIMSSLSSSKRFINAQVNKRKASSSFSEKENERSLLSKSQRQDPPKLSHLNMMLDEDTPLENGRQLDSPQTNGHAEPRKSETTSTTVKESGIDDPCSNVVAIIDDYYTDREAEQNRVKQMLKDIDSSFTEKEDQKTNGTSLAMPADQKTPTTLATSATSGDGQITAIGSPVRSPEDSHVTKAGTLPSYSAAMGLTTAAGNQFGGILSPGSTSTTTMPSGVGQALGSVAGSSAIGLGKATSLPTPSFAGFGSTAATTTTASVAAGGFTFGAAPSTVSTVSSTVTPASTAVAPAVGGFSFGSSASVPAATATSPPAVGGFSFGGAQTSLTSTAVTTVTPASGFTFGASAATTKPSPSGFLMGTLPTSAPSVSGVSALGTSSASSQAFSGFGAPTVSAGGFSFGAKATPAATATTTTALSGFTAVQASSAPTAGFSFGAGSSQGPTPAAGFGLGASTASTTGFSFGTGLSTAATSGSSLFSTSLTTASSLFPSTVTTTSTSGLTPTFGTNSTDAGGFGAITVKTSSTAGFSFGTSQGVATGSTPFEAPTTATQSGFVFGAVQSTSSGSIPFGAPATATQSGFSFGASQSTNSSSTPFGAPTTATQSGFSSRASQSTNSSSTPFGALTTTTQSGFSSRASQSTNSSSTPFGALTKATQSGFSSMASQSNSSSSTPFGAPTTATQSGFSSMASQSTNSSSTPFGAPTTATQSGFSSMASQSTSSSSTPFGALTTATQSGFSSMASQSNSSSSTPFGAPTTATQSGFSSMASQSTSSRSTPFGALTTATQSEFSSRASQSTSSPPFGAPNTATQPGFSFGAAQRTCAASTPFGAPTTATTQSGFKFGASQSTSSGSSPFGAPATATQSGFSFGAAQSTSSASTPFGAPATATTQSGFTFGASQSTSSGSTPFGAPATATQSGFTFGATANTTSSGPAPFSFGAGTSQVAAPAFGTSTQPSAASTFNFGQGTSKTGGASRGDQSDVDTNKLPEAVPQGIFKPVCVPEGDLTLIAFDLETTGLGYEPKKKKDIKSHGGGAADNSGDVADNGVGKADNSGDMADNGGDNPAKGKKDTKKPRVIRPSTYVCPHITQIAAWNPYSNKSFDQYVLPKLPIEEQAQEITGISLRGTKMYHHDNEVHPSTITKALCDFFHWLEQFKNVLLIAHNGRSFDFPVLASALQSVGLQEKFLSCVLGCVDTKPYFKNQFPGRTSYKQEDLVKDILNSSYDAHNALADVMALGKLTIHVCESTTNKKIIDFSFSPKCVLYRNRFNQNKRKNLHTLNALFAKSVCSKSVCSLATAEQIAGSGLNLNHLRLIYEREGEDGLRNTFIVKNAQGKPRVDISEKLLKSAIPKLAEYFKDK